MELDEIELLYKKYGPMVLRRCRFLLRDEDRAFDAMQDVFVKLITHHKKLINSYPSSLLYKIATNICLNIIKSDNKKNLLHNNEILSGIASEDDFEEKIAVADILDKIFGREQVSTRMIAVMYYVDGMTLDEVASESGLSVSGVRKRLRTLSNKLKVSDEFT